MTENSTVFTAALPPVGSFDDFIGQQQLKDRLEVHIQSSLRRIMPLEHVLLSGPAGTGKTTMARLIALCMRDAFTEISCVGLNRKGLVRQLQQFKGGVLFLDEIHALKKADQEMLLSVLSQNVVIDERGRRWVMPWVTVIAATTERDKLIAPLHDRFPIKPEFAPYTDSELGEIVSGMASRMEITLDSETTVALGVAAGGVPRNAEEFIVTARDLMITNGGKKVGSAAILAVCGVDTDGLNDQHRRYLRILSEQGGRAGAKTIELLLQVPEPILRNLERLLMSRGLVELLPSGRELTPKGMSRVDGPAEGSEERTYTRR